MATQKPFNLDALLPHHSRLIPRLHPDLAAYSAGLPPAWQTALQEPGDPGQAVPRIWQPIQKIARGMIFRLENITLDLGLVVSDSEDLPPYLLYICEYDHTLHGWLAGTPIGDSEIQNFEDNLGIKLPSSYRRFLKIHNGFFDTERSEIGFLNLRQTYLIKFTELGGAEAPATQLLAFSMDRVGQVHTFDLNAPIGKDDRQTRIWDGENLRLSQPKSFWAFLKDFSIHSLR